METYIVVFDVETAVTLHIGCNWEGRQPANG